MVLVFLLIVLFGACTIEKARPFKKQQILIASDCLRPSDTILFKSFKKHYKIRVRILYLPVDSLQSKLKTEGTATEIDAVILSSVYSMYTFEKSKLLQKVPREDIFNPILNKYHSKSGKWTGIGIDPYVFINLKDTLKRVHSYKDLLNDTKWCTTLKTDEEWYPFYSNIVHKIMPKAK